MGSKNISIRDDIYRELKREKEEGESFSDTINRLLSSKNSNHPLYDIVGIMSEEEAVTARENMDEFSEYLEEELANKN